MSEQSDITAESIQALQDALSEPENEQLIDYTGPITFEVDAQGKKYIINTAMLDIKSFCVILVTFVTDIYLLNTVSDVTAVKASLAHISAALLFLLYSFKLGNKALKIQAQIDEAVLLRGQKSRINTADRNLDSVNFICFLNIIIAWGFTLWAIVNHW